MKTTNLNGKKYRVYSPNEFFSSPEGDQQKYFNLDRAKTGHANHSAQKKKTLPEDVNKD